MGVTDRLFSSVHMCAWGDGPAKEFGSAKQGVLQQHTPFQSFKYQLEEGDAQWNDGFFLLNVKT